MNIQKWLSENTHRLDGKRIAVTGSTGGLGTQLCGYLASLGASLLLLDRNPEKSAAHKKRLTERYPSVSVETFTVDLEKSEDVKRAAAFLAGESIDIFIHNAGAYSIPRHECDTGYDNVFQINFASPYYIIRTILPSLREHHGKVIIVGSIAHTYSHTDPSDVDFKKHVAAAKVYGNAKRYLMFSLYELFKEEYEASLSVVHPGITPTGITAHYPKWVNALIKYPMKWIFMSPRKAALCLLAGVFDECRYREWIGPFWFDVWGKPTKKKLLTCTAKESLAIAASAEKVFEHYSKG